MSLTEEQKIRLYYLINNRNGRTHVSIQDEFDITPYQYSKFKRTGSTQNRTRKVLTEEELVELNNCYNTRMTKGQICERFKITRYDLKKYLDKPTPPKLTLNIPKRIVQDLIKKFNKK